MCVKLKGNSLEKGLAQVSKQTYRVFTRFPLFFGLQIKILCYAIKTGHTVFPVPVPSKKEKGFVNINHNFFNALQNIEMNSKKSCNNNK